MRFMVIVYPGNLEGCEAGQMPDARLLERMGKFNEELVEAGVMLSGDGLHPSSKGARIHFLAGRKPRVSHGPFSDERLVCGFWMWQVKSRDEALEWAQRAPMEDGATLELRQVFEPEDFGPKVAAQERELMEKMKQKS